MYGCAPKTLAITLGKPASHGDRLMNAFWDAYPALKMLNEALKTQFKANGHLVGIDGRIMHIREERKLLNSLLQGNSAIVFKRWMINCNEWVHQVSLDDRLKQITAYHDELQWESRESDKAFAIEAGEKFCQIALDTGLEMGINVPIEAKADVGKNLSETH